MVQVTDYDSAKEIKISLSFLDKIRHLLMGRKKPNFFTRVIYYLGLTFGWFYFFIWFVTSYFSVVLTNMLDPSAASMWKARFNQIGAFISDDPLKTFQSYALIQIAIFTALFFGLCFFWRKWKIGLYLVIFTHLAAILVTYLMMGWEYISEHVSLMDKIIYGIGTLPFVVYLIFRKKKKKDESLENV